MRPPVTATDENPAPMFFAVITRRGPPCGHCRSRPVSGECPSRLGPRHVGQSAAERAAAGAAPRCGVCPSTTVAALRTITARTLAIRDLIWTLLLELEYRLEVGDSAIRRLLAAFGPFPLTINASHHAFIDCAFHCMRSARRDRK